jgi:hypothetical protein
MHLCHNQFLERGWAKITFNDIYRTIALGMIPLFLLLPSLKNTRQVVAH